MTRRWQICYNLRDCPFCWSGQSFIFVFLKINLFTEQMTALKRYSQLLKTRSAEHKAAIEQLYPIKLYGQVMSIIRQELDSLIRVFYLLACDDIAERETYITQTLNNDRMRNRLTGKYITDRDMVERFNKLQGWPKYVYNFGCGFIHLSNMIDYKHINPFDNLTNGEKTEIVKYMHQYHGYPQNQPLNMESVVPYLPAIFEKITSNLSYYIEDLENSRVNASIY